MIQLDKGVPIPKRPVGGRNLIYPFHIMEVGDSFEFPAERKLSVSALAGLRGREIGAKFSIRKTGQTYRCWRTA